MRLFDHSIPITLSVKTKVGMDGFNSPIYEYNDTIVEHCLVAMDAHEQVLDASSLLAKKDTFTIAIPKGDTHDWIDTIVKFTMGGVSYECRTFGDYETGVDGLIPLEWHKKIRCIDIR